MAWSSNNCAFLIRIIRIGRISIFLHWLIMEGSRNWPNLRSSISKIRDMQVVGTINVTRHQKIENIRLIIVDLIRVQTFLEVRSRDSTWSPDLWWPRVNFCTIGAEKMGDKLGENPAALRAAVFPLSAKDLREHLQSTPPPPPRYGAEYRKRRTFLFYLTCDVIGNTVVIKICFPSTFFQVIKRHLNFENQSGSFGVRSGLWILNRTPPPPHTWGAL